MFFFLSLASCNNIIVIDAGSTGSGLYIYSYENSDDLNSFTAFRDSQGQQAYFRSNIPFHTSINDTQKLDQVFTELIVNGSNIFLSPVNRTLTPIFILLTGAVRILPKTEQETIRTVLYKYLKSHFDYEIKYSYVRVVSGDEEGLFAWISTNFICGFLKSGNTIAVAEMSGTFLQFAVEAPKDYPSGLKKCLYRINDGNHTYKVFFHSWNAFGDKSVTDYVDQYIYNTTGKTVSPCYFNESVQEIVLKDGPHNFTGQTNFDKCQELIAMVYSKLQSNLCGKIPAFFMDGDECIPYPGDVEKIHTYGVFFYSLDFLNYSSYADFQNYIDTIYKLGNLTYPEAQNLNVSYKYTKRCLMQAHMVISFLIRGLNGDFHRMYRYRRDELASLSLDWTFGAAIYMFLSVLMFGSPW
ncbi:hypothetical protein TVAG_101640 [Trichomonas vaginalis G3]|uniref:Uncharacterized protein n=1 Tax=Trichomonas vaginalis (strain ATCC PRA-98 / G3) TaxID=412133 RepID=A2DJP6_TRIV3|nr:8-oxo-dGTP phosphohydrolase protein [Trichomonas vaginalis G3]EAY19446.1 hypothetical protein TVAG_101640 [Trichomonas vaginalis G3]KAI5493147.1 8-oxo-dGTP phosphohydrolase protein [Trichomonas vaginalis G3]|eukprot:XP_001580432.1 hypothetical protein [Trichomonas vaginalis G3]